MIAGLSAHEQDGLRRGLQQLPDTVPPRVVWERIREQAEAEGLMVSPSRGRRAWYYGGGLAAAVALSAMLVLQQATPVDDAGRVHTVPQNLPTNDGELTGLQALMVQSQQLEADLRALPASPRVKNVGTTATITELKDRIATIDYQLNDTSGSLSPEEKEVYWRERVRLMKLLVGLRYAQAQRTAF